MAQFYEFHPEEMMAELHPDPVINQLMGELQKIRNPEAVPIIPKRPNPEEEAKMRMDQFEKERAWHMLRAPLNGITEGKVKDCLADLKVALARIENNLSYKDMAGLVALLDNFSAPSRKIRVVYNNIPKWIPGWTLWSLATVKRGQAVFFQEPIGALADPTNGRCISPIETSMVYPGYLPEPEGFEASKIFFFPNNQASAVLMDEARHFMEIEEAAPTRGYKKVHTPELTSYLRPCPILTIPNQPIVIDVVKTLNQNSPPALGFGCKMVMASKEPFHVKIRILRTNRFEGLELLCLMQGKYLKKED
jgi:hypothetical protein